MGIHSLLLPDGIDVHDALARAEDGEDTCESQDNPGRDDWEALRHAESAYFAMMAGMARRAEPREFEALTGHSIRRERRKHRRRELHDSPPYGD